MKRKGIASGVLLLVILALGTYQLYYTAMVGLSGVRVGVRRYQEDIYALQNSLDAAKEYLRTSLRYSAYQACYDNLKNGGWAEISGVPDDKKVVFNGEHYMFLTSESQFKTELGKSILANINRYSSDEYNFMGIYSVDMPAYKLTKARDYHDNTMTIDAVSDENLEIIRYVEKLKLGESFFKLKESAKEDDIEEKITLRKRSELNETIETPCYGLYQKALEQSVKTYNTITTLLEHSIDRLKQKTESRDSPQACEEMISQKEEDIRNDLTGRGGDVEYEALEVDLALTLQTPLASDEQGKFTCAFNVDGESSATVKVTLNGPVEEKFPVWNGQKLAFEPLMAVFLVKGEYSP